MWEPLSRNFSSRLELSLFSLVLDSNLKDLLTVILACILINIFLAGFSGEAVKGTSF
jgi:hypothetical protein